MQKDRLLPETGLYQLQGNHTLNACILAGLVSKERYFIQPATKVASIFCFCRQMAKAGLFSSPPSQMLAMTGFYSGVLCQISYFFERANRIACGRSCPV
jgi:hypothetical protein